MRPNPWQWLRYSFGAGLPPELNDWVLHDITSGTWWARQVLRSVLQLAVPIALVLVFVPGAFWIRGLCAVGGVIMGLIFSIGFLVETTEHRLVKAGFAVGTGERIRSERSRTGRTAATALRRQKMADRMDRRRA